MRRNSRKPLTDSRYRAATVRERLPRQSFLRAGTPKISLVVTSLNEGASLRQTVEHLQSTLPKNAEVLVVDDGSEDGSTGFLARSRNHLAVTRTNHLGVAKSRNWGARQTTGEVIIFADAHIRAPRGWWAPMIRLLEKPAVGAVAPAICDTRSPDCKGFGLRLTGPELTADWLPQRRDAPYPVPILPGCCLAMRRDTFDKTGGFDDGLLGWGGVDNELGVRLWLLGYQLWLAPAIEVGHVFRQKPPYSVEWSSVLHNRLRLAFCHFGRHRITRVIEALQRDKQFAAALALTMDSDVTARRRALAACRAHDDEWLFQKFRADW